MKLDNMVRRTLLLVLVLTILPRLASSASREASVRTQIDSVPLGAKIELRLKNKQKIRGRMVKVSDSSVTLADLRARETQISFVEVVSVNELGLHTGRSILIGVSIGLVALGSFLL